MAWAASLHTRYGVSAWNLSGMGLAAGRDMRISNGCVGDTHWSIGPWPVRQRVGDSQVLGIFQLVTRPSRLQAIGVPPVSRRTAGEARSQAARSGASHS